MLPHTLEVRANVYCELKDKGLTFEEIKYILEAPTLPMQPSLADIRLDEMGLSVRVYNTLKRERYLTAEAIDNADNDTLLGLDGFGHASLGEVRSKIHQLQKE